MLGLEPRHARNCAVDWQPAWRRATGTSERNGHNGGQRLHPKRVIDQAVNQREQDDGEAGQSGRRLEEPAPATSRQSRTAWRQRRRDQQNRHRQTALDQQFEQIVMCMIEIGIAHQVKVFVGLEHGRRKSRSRSPRASTDSSV